MNKSMKIISILTVFLLAISLASTLTSALIVSSVDSPVLAPGEEGRLTVILKNTFDNDIEDVSLSLDLSTIPFTAVGSSEFSLNRIDNDDKESFVFLLRADSSAKTGDYSIPYTITYRNSSTPKKGTIGIKISAKPNLDFTSSTDIPVIGQKSKLTLKIVNKGLGDAKFVSFTLSPDGLTLLSEPTIYIGSIDSDDFESASFDVIYQSKSATLAGNLEYRDIDNKLYTKSISIPVEVYTKDEAIKKGIIQKSNTTTYILVVVILIVLWLIWRAIAKRRRLKKSMQKMKESR